MATVHIDDVSLASTVVVRDTEEQFAVVVEDKVSVVTEGVMGPPGKDGVGVLSDAPGNALQTTSDGKLYVPDDIPTDPLAFYILARS